MVGLVPFSQDLCIAHGIIMISAEILPVVEELPVEHLAKYDTNIRYVSTMICIQHTYVCTYTEIHCVYQPIHTYIYQIHMYVTCTYAYVLFATVIALFLRSSV